MVLGSFREFKEFKELKEFRSLGRYWCGGVMGGQSSTLAGAGSERSGDIRKPAAPSCGYIEVSPAGCRRHGTNDRTSGEEE